MDFLYNLSGYEVTCLNVLARGLPYSEFSVQYSNKISLFAFKVSIAINDLLNNTTRDSYPYLDLHKEIAEEFVRSNLSKRGDLS